MDQIQRIRHMESILDRCCEALYADPPHRLELSGQFDELIAYYTSPLWIQDLEDDRAGKLPPDLKRGVLSEDAVYNLLCDWNQRTSHI